MTLKYIVAVKAPHEREKIISSQAKTPLRKFQSYDVFEGTPVELDVIRIPVDIPIYRMANGRTQTEQMAYTAGNKLPADYFSSGEENETVQQVQHQILWRFAQEGNKSVTPIASVLEKEQQREPILITPRGVVVNGNRRLAAIREMHAESSEDFPNFATIECAVLPNLTPSQIVDIEVRLQMRPETKLDYSWIDQCLMIQRLKNNKKDDAEIARLIRARPKDVKAALSALAEADIYLRDWLKAPGDYRLVKDDEQFFYDLPKRLVGKSGELLEASRRIAWILVQNSDSLGQRVYAFNAMFGEKAAEVISRLSHRLDISLAAEKPPAESKEEKLEVDFGEPSPDEGSTSFKPLISAIDEPARRDEIRDQLITVCQTMVDASRTEAVGKSALFAVRDANTRLTEVDLTKAAADTIVPIERHLDEIIRRAHELKDKLQSYKPQGGTIAKDDRG